MDMFSLLGSAKVKSARPPSPITQTQVCQFTKLANDDGDVRAMGVHTAVQHQRTTLNMARIVIRMCTLPQRVGFPLLRFLMVVVYRLTAKADTRSTTKTSA